MLRRSTQARLVALTAAVGVGVAMLPAHAATTTTTNTVGTPVAFTDPSSDANFVNGQSVVGGAPSQATPAQDAAADITNVAFASTFVTTTTTKTVTTVVKKKKVTKTVVTVTNTPTGFQITMTLAAAPTQAETDYRITLTVPGCASNFYIESSTDPVLGGTVMRCGNTGATGTIPDAVTKGNTIVFTVPLSVVPAGAKLTSLAASTLVNAGGVITAPTIDEAFAPATTTFTVGR